MARTPTTPVVVPVMKSLRLIAFRKASSGCMLVSPFEPHTICCRRSGREAALFEFATASAGTGIVAARVRTRFAFVVAELRHERFLRLSIPRQRCHSFGE